MIDDDWRVGEKRLRGGYHSSRIRRTYSRPSPRFHSLRVFRSRRSYLGEGVWLSSLSRRTAVLTTSVIDTPSCLALRSSQALSSGSRLITVRIITDIKTSVGDITHSGEPEPFMLNVTLSSFSKCLTSSRTRGSNCRLQGRGPGGINLRPS